MEIILIVIASLILLALLTAGGFYLSLKRGGKFSQKVMSKAMTSEKVQSAVANKLQTEMENPDLLEKLEAEHGISRSQAEQALSSFNNMNTVQKQQVMKQASKAGGASEEELAQLKSELGQAVVQGQPPLRSSTSKQPVSKRKAANRSKNKAARKSRKSKRR